MNATVELDQSLDADLDATVSFRLLGDRLLIKPDKAPDRIGSIFIPPSSGEAHRRATGLFGTVMFMGPGMLCSDGSRWPMPEVRPGDRVCYLDQPWPRVKIGDEELLSIRQEGILGAIEDEK